MQVQVGARRGGGGKGRACPPQRGAGERSVARARGSCCRWGAGGVTRSRKGGAQSTKEMNEILHRACRRKEWVTYCTACCLLGSRPTNRWCCMSRSPGRRGLQSRRCYTGRPCLTPTGRLHRTSSTCSHHQKSTNSPRTIRCSRTRRRYCRFARPPVAGFCSWAQTPRLRKRSPHRSPTTLRTTLETSALGYAKSGAGRAQLSRSSSVPLLPAAATSNRGKHLFLVFETLPSKTWLTTSPKEKASN